jgi:signal transduction histidine kinase
MRLLKRPARNGDQSRGLFLVLLMIILLCLALWASSRAPEAKEYASSDSVWDLRGHDFGAGAAFLSGSTEFVLGELLTPEEFAASEKIQVLEVPDVRNARVLTTRLRILAPENRHLAFLRETRTGANKGSALYVNGDLLAVSGIPAMVESLSLPDEWVPFFTAQPQNGVVEIVIQTSNFAQRQNISQAGWYVGDELQILEMKEVYEASALILIGVYGTLFVIHLALLVLMPRFRANLWFALLCLVWALRSGVVPPKPLLILLPWLSWTTAFRIEYLAIPATMTLLTMAYHQIFPGALQKIPRLAIYLYSGAAAGICLFAPPLFMSRYVLGLELVAAVAAVYVLGRIVYSVRHPSTEQAMIMGGILLILFSVVFDTFHFGDYFGAGELSSLTGSALVMCFGFQMLALFWATLRQVTEAREAEKRIALEKEALESANRLKADLMATISHETRTPLAVIASYADIIMRELRAEGVSDQHARDLATITSHIAHVGVLMEEMSGMAKARDGDTGKTTVKLPELTAQTARLYSHILQRKGIALTVSVPEELPTVWVNPGEITQVLLNLLKNAGEHAGGEQVTLSVLAAGESLTVAVADDGGGFDPDILSRAFERGATKGGTGIGLAVCKEIVEKHGGTISIESELGRGAKVSFTLPIEKEEGSYDR